MKGKVLKFLKDELGYSVYPVFHVSRICLRHEERYKSLHYVNCVLEIGDLGVVFSSMSKLDYRICMYFYFSTVLMSSSV